MGSHQSKEATILQRAALRNYTAGFHMCKDLEREKAFAPSTLKAQNTALGHWELWRKNYDNDAPGASASARPPNLAALSDVLRIFVARGQGMLDEGISVRTAVAFLDSLAAGWKRVTKNHIPREIVDEARELARSSLVAEGIVSTTRKAKHLFGKDEYVRFMTTLWTQPESEFKHPRERIQCAFLVQVLTGTGACDIVIHLMMNGH